MRCWTGMKKSIHKHWNMWPTLSMTLTSLISTGALRANNLLTKIIFSCQMDYWIQKSFEGCWVFRKGWNSWIGIHKVMWWILGKGSFGKKNVWNLSKQNKKFAKFFPFSNGIFLHIFHDQKGFKKKKKAISHTRGWGWGQQCGWNPTHFFQNDLFP